MSGNKSYLTFDFNNVLAPRIGPEHGLREEELPAFAPRAKKALQEILQERAAGKHPFLDLPYDQKMLNEVKGAISELKEKFKSLVVLGIGGSALGTRALHSALLPPFYNLLPQGSRGAKLFILDNIDPELVGGLLKQIEPQDALFVVISKSGSTAETVAQFLFFRGLLKERLGKGFGRHILAITDPAKGDLRKIAGAEGYYTLPVPAGVGGRYSVLSPVGLFPAGFVGIDLDGLLEGARWMDEKSKDEDILKNPALAFASLLYLLHTKKGKPIAVMMPYANALYDLADWFRQLWAESLGKEFSLSGEKIYAGQTPVKALGTTDQHSQLQLYAQGPFDKVIIFLAEEKFRQEIEIPSGLEEYDAAGYLAGRTLNQLLLSELEGTEVALTRAKRPNLKITLSEVSSFTIGAWLYMLELATALAGKFYQVNAFDQPGVEASKHAAFALMGRPGYEKHRQEIETALKKDERFIIRLQ
jgi:glucose-6-phosphate isomerase